MPKMIDVAARRRAHAVARENVQKQKLSKALAIVAPALTAEENESIVRLAQEENQLRQCRKLLIKCRYPFAR